MEKSRSFVTYSVYSILNRSFYFKVCYVMMSIDMQDKVHFWMYLLNHKPLVKKFGQVTDRDIGNIFRKYLT